MKKTIEITLFTIFLTSCIYGLTLTAVYSYNKCLNNGGNTISCGL